MFGQVPMSRNSDVLAKVRASEAIPKPVTPLQPVDVPTSVAQAIQASFEGLRPYYNEILSNSNILVANLTIDRGFIARRVTVTTTPVRIVQARSLKAYMFLNPTASTGAGTSGTLLASSAQLAGASGNTQATSLDVSDYQRLTMFLDITASTGGVITVNTQSKDPLSGNWATVQGDVFGAPSAVGTYYATIGTLGVDEDFAVAWDVSAAGNSTFSLSYLLKDSSVAFGTANTIYLGASGVTTSTGFPLLEGKELKTFVRTNTEIWAVSPSAAGIPISIFELR